ncbi:MBL fold metallo-hydrolase [Labrys miyagiensis]|uniref:MBL fold metallo-hydrolase n=2 Tax=Labrys miyagiensis TaxID=346912 RepID=A0ABQ6CEH1_9HYPH|nr:MBL fold metallo-hydrolase [Labrys miyagiensis]
MPEAMHAPVPAGLGPAPFDGRRFSNLSGPDAHGFASVLKWMLTRRRARWPKRLEPIQAAPPPDRVDDGTIRAALIGHATVLLQLAGLNILTDPMLSRTAGPLPWLGVKRVRDPAFALADLPPIDLVLLSHNHYDHLDRSTLAALVGRDDPLILTGLRTGRSVPSGRVVELDWGQSHQEFGLRATFVPAEHFSARGPFDRNAALWGGFVLETALGRIYFAGDSGDGAHFAAIRRHFGPMTLSLIPIGAYEPRWFMSPVHMDPAEALAASLTLESQVSLAIHHGTFPLADDAIDAPPRLLAEALASAAPAGRGLDFRTPALGQPVIVAASGA